MNKLQLLQGNDGLKTALDTALAAGRLPHAVLLAGPDGCGRNFAARLLAADYLFPAGGPGAEAVLRNESSEVLPVEGEGKSGQIRVERIRQVRNDIFHSSLSAAGRVVLVRDAHKINIPAANSLLKVLEEPPAGALFILTARDAASLPFTIQSRCALYPLAPVAPALCETALQQALPAGADPALPSFLALLYGGRIGSGMAVLAEEARLQVLQAARQLAKAAAEKNRYELLRVFAGFEGRAEGENERRDALLGDLAEILACCLRGEQHRALPAATPQQAAALLPKVMEARQALGTNAAPKLLFAALAARMAAAAEGAGK